VIPGSTMGSEDRPYPLRTRRLALVALVVIWVAFDYPAFGGRVLFPTDLDRTGLENPFSRSPPKNPLEGDAYTLYYPLRDHLGDRLRHGDVPLWDPHRFAGLPFAANSQAAVWYPPNWLFAAGDALTVYSWILVASRLGALLLAYWFFRQLRLHPYAAVTGSTIFTFSGFLTAWAVHATFPSSALWLPLALGGLTMAQRGERSLGIALASLGLGLSILGGHPQVSIFVWLAAAVWGAVGVIASMIETRRSGRPSFLSVGTRGAAVTLAPFALGAGLAAIQVLGSVEFSGYTIRGVEEYEGLAASGPSLQQLGALLLLPDRFGNPVDGNYSGPANYTEFAVYAGVVTLAWAAYAVIRRRDRWTIGFAALGAVGVLSVLGTPLFRLLYLNVPGLARMRAVGRFGFLIDVALSGLAALGLDELLRRRRERLGGIFALAAAILAVLILATVAGPETPPLSYLLPRTARTAGVVIAAALSVLWLTRSSRPTVLPGIGLALVAAADLWLFAFPYHAFQSADPIYRRDEVVEYLASRGGPRPRFARLREYWIPQNGAMIYGLYDIQGYDNFIPASYVDLVSLPQDQHSAAGDFNVVYNLEPPAIDSPVLDLLGVESILADPAETALGPPSFSGASYASFDRPGTLPPAFLASCWQLLPQDEVVPRLETMSSAELSTTAVVADGPLARRLLGAPPEGGCDPGPPASIGTYRPELVVVSAAPARRSLLVLSDTWDPGWRARVDGDAVPILPVDRALRGVVLPPGKHTITFAYRPSWLVPGSTATLASVAVVILLLVLPPLQRRRQRRREPTEPSPAAAMDASGSHRNP
jgi:hypothetical protein